MSESGESVEQALRMLVFNKRQEMLSIGMKMQHLEKETDALQQALEFWERERMSYLPDDINRRITEALRVLSRVAENLKEIEKKIDDPDRILVTTVERIHARMRDAQEGFDIKWYEIDDEDRAAVMSSRRTNWEF